MKKPNKIIILTLILVVVTVVTGVVVIYIPFLNKSKSIRADILRQKERNILAGNIRALGKHLKLYKKRIPVGRSVSWLLNEVSDMATKEGVEISSVKPGAPENRGRYTKIYVAIDAICTYGQLGRFISRVESSEKFLRMENINIKRIDSERDFEENIGGFKRFDVKVSITISAIVFKE